jgi:glycosyltransferase involved in cell wall biosynthesis
LNGDVVRLTTLIKALKRLGHQVIVITAFPHYSSGGRGGFSWKPIVVESRDGVTVVRTPIVPLEHKGAPNRLLLYSSYAIGASLVAVWGRKADLVWAFSQKISSDFPAFWVKLFSGTKIVSDVTDIWPEALVNTGYASPGMWYGLVNGVCNAAYRLSDAITTLTPSMKSLLSERHGLHHVPVFIVPNVLEGVRIPTPTKIERGGKFTVAYFGNLGANYDFETVLRAARRIKENPNIKFKIHGRGESSGEIAQAVKSEGLSNVNVETTVMTEEELEGFLAGADAFLLPMKKATFPDASLPIKLAEYLRCGRPVLCLGEGYLRNLIKESEAGISLTPGDDEGLASAITELSTNAEKVAAYGASALQLYQKEYTFDRMLSSLREMFDELGMG